MKLSGILRDPLVIGIVVIRETYDNEQIEWLNDLEERRIKIYFGGINKINEIDSFVFIDQCMYLL